MYGVGIFNDSNVPDNQYRLHCPIVGRDAKLTECWDKRELHMRGEYFPATDCRCAMRGSKCPAMVMLDIEWRSHERKFFDAGSSIHRLTNQVAERLEKVQLFPSFADGLTITDDQAKQLFGKVVGPQDKIKLDGDGHVSDNEKQVLDKPRRGRPPKMKA